jgi:predicted dehydrogenase
VGDRAAVELPHNAYIPWAQEASFTLRQGDQETGHTITVAGADEYRLMVEHFADAVRGVSELDFTPDDSIQNMAVLDALAQAAQTGATIRLDR